MGDAYKEKTQPAVRRVKMWYLVRYRGRPPWYEVVIAIFVLLLVLAVVLS
jgi:hypothetical protein